MEYFQWARNKLYGSDMEEWAIKKKQQPKLHRVNSPPKMTSIRSSSYYVWSNFALHDTFSFFVCVCVHFYFEWSKCLLLLSRVNCELYTRTHTHTFKYARYWVIRDQFFFIQSRSNLLLGLWPFTLKILRKANIIFDSLFAGWIYKEAISTYVAYNNNVEQMLLQQLGTCQKIALKTSGVYCWTNTKMVFRWIYLPKW